MFVAIRCLELFKRYLIRNLKRRLDMLSKLCHPHLLCLLGHCIDSVLDDSGVIRVFLIYECATHGNFHTQISECSFEWPFKWSERLAVLNGVAKAVHFLHMGIIPGIFNNHLKSTNILLDEHLIAKVSDYGLSIVSEEIYKHKASAEGSKNIQSKSNLMWNQMLEFLDDGSSLILHVKDHNTVLPESSIGHCTVEYRMLPPNQTADKWIPLQGVKSGEIHIKITRRVPESEKKLSKDNNYSLSKGNLAFTQMRDILNKFHALIEDGDIEGLSMLLSEAGSAEDKQETYMIQLEKEKQLLIDKIGELGHEISRTTSAPTRIPY